MGRLGYAAVNLGERELLGGYERLQQEMKKAAFPFISGNMVYQDSGEPFLEKSLIRTVEAGGPEGKKRKIRVGILGLARMNPGLSQQTPDGRRIVTTDPVAVARETIPSIRKKSDLVVVLATMEPDQVRSLVKEVPGIDLVLGAFGAVQLAGVEAPSQDPAKPVRLVYAGNQGKKMGEIRVFLGEDGKPGRTDANLVNLGKIVPDDPDLADLMEKNRAAINEINRKNAPMVDGEKMRETYEGAAYVRSEACKSCHEEAFKAWQESKHAHAFRILEEKHQDYNPACVGCHTTGFRRPTGFVNAKSTPDLMNVQCEACHGPGKGHPETMGKEYGRAGVETCKVCHTADNSPDFDPTAYMVKIRHWETEKSPAAAASPR